MGHRPPPVLIAAGIYGTPGTGLFVISNDKLSGKLSECSGYPFIPVNTIPSTKYLCKKIYSIKIGITEIIEPAINKFHFMVNCPLNNCRPTVNVRISSEFAITRGHNRLFHCHMKQKTASPARSRHHQTLNVPG
jgi:hypothetical protein